MTVDSFLKDGVFHANRLLEFLDLHGPILSEVPNSLRRIVQGSRRRRCLRAILIGGSRGDRTDTVHAGKVGTNSSIEVKDSIDAALARVSGAVSDVAATGRDGVAEAISAYGEELEDLDSVNGMIEKYSGVVAATCQQSVMQDYKFVDYDLVIVDEAARVSPMDLLIPMSHGKRIVLVGDHKQLPHMLEPEVRESFIKSGRGSREFVEESLFQRLFEKFTAVHEAGERNACDSPPG